MSDLPAGPVILVDADACPVKEEIYKVAWRHDVPVRIVSNARLRVPEHPLIERVTVSDAFDAADDWIAERAGPGAVVVTGDILLADRCLKAGAAAVIAPNGRPFTAASIGGGDRDPGDHGRPARRRWTGPAAGRRRSPRRTGRASCRRSTRRWCGRSAARSRARRRGGEAPDAGRLRI